jgi:hypothetical protein
MSFSSTALSIQIHASTCPLSARNFTVISSELPIIAEQQTTNLQGNLETAWTYGIELWGLASPSNIAKIQRYQSKLLRLITNAPVRYKSNSSPRPPH